MVLLSTCPSVSMPVIFGGGITIEKAGFDERGLAWKSQFSIQRRYHFGSTLFGSYLLESSAIAMKSSGTSCGLQLGRDAVLRRPDRRSAPSLPRLPCGEPLETSKFPLQE